MSYTNEELAVIDGIIRSLYPHMADAKLRKSFHILHEHLQDGTVNRIDLQRIDSALALVDPGRCVSCTMESYRELLSLRVKTTAMLART